MAEMRDRLDAPILAGVGAAFDFHAGIVPQAPAWMQRVGLEWSYRLARGRAGCGGATRATTRASSRGSSGSTSLTATSAELRARGLSLRAPARRRAPAGRARPSSG